MFKREAAEIEKVDGRVRRVVLDYELKKRVYPALAKAKALSVSEYTKAQAEIARAHGLKVVNKHIVLPDLRIEYEDRHGIAAQKPDAAKRVRRLGTYGHAQAAQSGQRVRH